MTPSVRTGKRLSRGDRGRSGARGRWPLKPFSRWAIGAAVALGAIAPVAPAALAQSISISAGLPTAFGPGGPPMVPPPLGQPTSLTPPNRPISPIRPPMHRPGYPGYGIIPVYPYPYYGGYAQPRAQQPAPRPAAPAAPPPPLTYSYPEATRATVLVPSATAGGEPATIVVIGGNRSMLAPASYVPDMRGFETGPRAVRPAPSHETPAQRHETPEPAEAPPALLKAPAVKPLAEGASPREALFAEEPKFELRPQATRTERLVLWREAARSSTQQVQYLGLANLKAEGALAEAADEWLLGLRAGSPEIRRLAVGALGGMAGEWPPALAEPLLDALADPDPDTRFELIKALAAREDRVLPRLQPAIAREQATADRSIKAIVLLMGARAAPDLAALLDDPNPNARYKAAWLLGELGPLAASALPALEAREKVERDRDVQYYLRAALSELRK